MVLCIFLFSFILFTISLIYNVFTFTTPLLILFIFAKLCYMHVVSHNLYISIYWRQKNFISLIHFEIHNNNLNKKSMANNTIISGLVVNLECVDFFLCIYRVFLFEVLRKLAINSVFIFFAYWANKFTTLKWQHCV